MKGGGVRMWASELSTSPASCFSPSLWNIPAPASSALEMPSWGQRLAGNLLCLQVPHVVISEEGLEGLNMSALSEVFTVIHDPSEPRHSTAYTGFPKQDLV